MKFSIIMTASDRLNHLRNTLESWSELTYPDHDFCLIDNASKQEVGIYNLAVEFSTRINNFHFWRVNEPTNVNLIWNSAGKKSSGEYIVFAMQDEIISRKCILEEMLNREAKVRFSVQNYFLSEDMTNKLPAGWERDATLIEEMDGFWDYAWDRVPNRRKTDAPNLAHVTGWTREGWDWFGWFRNQYRGYRWLDQDVVMRENALGIRADTVFGISCYHQWHGDYGSSSAVNVPGYIYENERQARLLEEARHE